MGRVRVAQVIAAVSLIIAAWSAIAGLRARLASGIYTSRTTKICQLTGQEDREHPGRPTGTTLGGQDSGVTGTDLGYPVERGDQLLFLFGDSREVDPDLCEPNVCGCSALHLPGVSPSTKLLACGSAVFEHSSWEDLTRSRGGFDTIATAPARADPGQCLPLQFLADPPDALGAKAHAVTVDGRYLPGWEIPTSGFTDPRGTVFAFFALREGAMCGTEPFGCSVVNSEPGGKSVLAMSEDGGRSFVQLYDWSRSKFMWPIAEVAKSSSIPNLPPHLTGDVVLVWSAAKEGRSGLRASYPYLAVAPMSFVGLAESWRYYAGRSPDGLPLWSAREADARRLPPFGSETVTGASFHKCLGESSVRFSALLGKWLMLYQCGGAQVDPAIGPGIYLRTADTPWGGWSPPHLVLSESTGRCHYYHADDATPGACQSTDPNPAEEGMRAVIKPDDGVKFVKRDPGSIYAPYLLPSRYMQLEGDDLAIYFTLSTWNPYQVILMKTQIRPSSLWHRAGTRVKVESAVALGLLLALAGSLVVPWLRRRGARG
jgi:hypothetical protein